MTGGKTLNFGHLKLWYYIRLCGDNGTYITGKLFMMVLAFSQNGLDLWSKQKTIASAPSMHYTSTYKYRYGLFGRFVCCLSVFHKYCTYQRALHGHCTCCPYLFLMAKLLNEYFIISAYPLNEEGKLLFFSRSWHIFRLLCMKKMLLNMFGEIFHINLIVIC